MNPSSNDSIPSKQGRFAIVSDKQLGDVTLLEPTTRLLAERSGQSTALFVNEAFRPLVELMPEATWGPDLKERFGCLWATSWSSRVVMRGWKVRARLRCLLVNQERHIRWWYRLLYSQVQITSIRDEYWSHYFWRALGGEKEAFRSPQLRQPPESWRHPELPEGPFVLINPTAAWPSKYWQPESWVQLMQAETPIKNLPWVMTGGGSAVEREHCAAIASVAPAGLLDLAGRTSLKQYLHALSRASLVLCVDGAASHLAQAFGVPAITLFGPVYPAKWHWPTPKHRSLSAFFLSEARPLLTSTITPEKVVSEVNNLLREFPEIIQP